MSKVQREPEVQSDPHTGSGVYRGPVPDGPGQSVPAGGPDRRASSPCQNLLQSRAVQDSSTLRGLLGLMGATLQSVAYSYLHMHPIQ